MVTILFLFSACMYIISDCNTNGEFFTLTHSNRLRGTVLKNGPTSAIECALRCNLHKACKQGGVVHISERENKCMMKNEKGGMFFEGKNTIVMTKTQLKKDHILVLRRVSDSVSFARTWFEYKHGFGNVKGNYWIGNEKLHEMSQRNVKLRIEFTRFNGEKYYAEYDKFQVENEGDQYRLNIGDYTGNATDAMSYLNGMKFSTLDRDNDENTSINCVTTFPGLGGWWNNQCTQVVLTGRYYGKGETSPTNGGIHWIPVTGSGESLKYVEIKLLI